MTVLDHWNVALDADQVLRAQGADPASIRSRKPALVEIAEWAVKEGLPLLEPKVLFRQFQAGPLRHERLELAVDGGRRFLAGALVAQHLGAAKEVLALVCTVGERLESVAAEVMESDPLMGWALDSLGSAAVEALALDACNHFEALAAGDEMQTTLPLSPGMIGWPVEQGQPQIFSLVDAGQIGVSITPYGMMQPRKTLSMVLGLGSTLTKGGCTCDYCSLSETCRYQNYYAPAV
jgi:hypothetical protein